MALFTDKQLMVGGAAVVVGGYLLWRQASPIIDAVNPTNNNNIFNRGFNSLYEMTWWADEGDTLGTDIADLEAWVKGFGSTTTDTITGN